MSKVRIYIRPDQISKIIRIDERNVVHKIKDVLRLGADDRLYVFDGQGKEYLCKIEEVAKKYVLIEQKGLEQKEPKPRKRIILGFPLVGEERIDFILQKSTELGVSGFIPFICQRSLRLRSANKLERWKRIIIEAARQSERLWIPSLSGVLEFSELIRLKYQIKLAGFINGGPIEGMAKLKEGDVFIAIGPVGDFSPDEYEKLKENDFKFIKLSSNLLRVETAAMLSVGLVRYFVDKVESREKKHRCRGRACPAL